VGGRSSASSKPRAATGAQNQTSQKEASPVPGGQRGTPPIAQKATAKPAAMAPPPIHRPSRPRRQAPQPIVSPAATINAGRMTSRKISVKEGIARSGPLSPEYRGEGV